jgi:hypothetical protein
MQMGYFLMHLQEKKYKTGPRAGWDAKFLISILLHETKMFFRRHSIERVGTLAR